MVFPPDRLSSVGLATVAETTSGASGPVLPLAFGLIRSLASVAGLATVAEPTSWPLSLFPSPHNFDIPPNSALRSSLRNPPTRPKHQGTATTRRSYAHESWEKPNRVQRGKVVDQPVTFHTRIKSSGYGATQPRIKLGGSSGTVTAGGGSGKPAGRRHPNPLHHSYPLECGLLTSRQPQHELPVPMDVPLVGLAYSSNAQVLAVAARGGGLELRL